MYVCGESEGGGNSSSSGSWIIIVGSNSIYGNYWIAASISGELSSSAAPRG